MKWQQREKGNVCEEFAKFVDTWDEKKTEIRCLYHEKTNRSVIFDMSANGEKFSFRRVGLKYSILFKGRYEFIQKETFSFFESVCEEFVDQVKARAIY